MDRARLSGYIPANETDCFKKNLLEKRRSEHLERLDTIQSRSQKYYSGPSEAPVLQLGKTDGFVIHSKRIFQQSETEFRNQFGNRELLQRISAIKNTEPSPEYTDRDYKNMKKKFIPRSRTYRDVHKQYEQMVRLKIDQGRRNDAKATYDFKEYESDYKKQLHQQRFLRQVVHDPAKPFQSRSSAFSRLPQKTASRPSSALVKTAKTKKQQTAGKDKPMLQIGRDGATKKSKTKQTNSKHPISNKHASSPFKYDLYLKNALDMKADQSHQIQGEQRGNNHHALGNNEGRQDLLDPEPRNGPVEASNNDEDRFQSYFSTFQSASDGDDEGKEVGKDDGSAGSGSDGEDMLDFLDSLDCGKLSGQEQSIAYPPSGDMVLAGVDENEGYSSDNYEEDDDFSGGNEATIGLAIVEAEDPGKTDETFLVNTSNDNNKEEVVKEEEEEEEEEEQYLTSVTRRIRILGHPAPPSEDGSVLTDHGECFGEVTCWMCQSRQSLVVTMVASSPYLRLPAKPAPSSCPTTNGGVTFVDNGSSGGGGRIKEEAKVEANYRGKGRYYPGRVKRDRGDGTFDVDYDDGEIRLRMKEENIQLIGGGGGGEGTPVASPRRSDSKEAEKQHERGRVATTAEATLEAEITISCLMDLLGLADSGNLSGSALKPEEEEGKEEGKENGEGQGEEKEGEGGGKDSYDKFKSDTNKECLNSKLLLLLATAVVNAVEVVYPASTEPRSPFLVDPTTVPTDPIIHTPAPAPTATTTVTSPSPNPRPQLVIHIVRKVSTEAKDSLENAQTEEDYGYPSLLACSDQFSVAADTENVLLPDRRETLLRAGCKLPVTFNVNFPQRKIYKIKDIMELAGWANKVDTVLALAKFESTADGKIRVTTIVQTNTIAKRYYEITARRHLAKPAVRAGHVVEGFFALPSIAHADPDMVASFVRNLASNMMIEHDLKHGTNSLVLTKREPNLTLE